MSETETRAGFAAVIGASRQSAEKAAARALWDREGLSV